jgi:hypothetical protein
MTQSTKRLPTVHEARAQLSNQSGRLYRIFKIFSSQPQPRVRPRPKRIRRYGGLATATFGAVALAFLSFWDVLVPPDHLPETLSIVGLATLAIVAGLLTMMPAILAAKEQSIESAQHRALRRRLLPILYAGMEEVVDRWAEFLLPGVQLNKRINVDPELELELHVFLKIDGYYRIVSSSVQESASVRRLELAEDEGMVHMVYSRNTAVVAQVQSDYSAKLYSRNGQAIADQPSLTPKNADKCNPDLKWIYATPIFAKRSTHPYSNETLGVLTVDGLQSMSDNLFFKADFRELVESIALQLAPYVSAFNSLMESDVDAIALDAEA